MSKSKATHFGECQVCGNRQKLPYGLMAKHGYTKGFGFFSGTCRGSDHLPFELSCDLVESSIQNARALVKLKQEFSSKLKALPTDDVKEAHVSHYHTNRYYGRGALKSGYYNIIAVVEKYRDGSYTYTGTFNGEEVKGSHDTYIRELNIVPLLIQHINTRYATSVIDKEIKIGKDYIVWATERVKNWQPKELTQV